MRVSITIGLMLGAAFAAPLASGAESAAHTYFCVAKPTPMDPNTYTSAEFTSSDGQTITARAFQNFLADRYGRDRMGGEPMCYPSSAASGLNTFKQTRSKTARVIDTGWAGAHG